MKYHATSVGSAGRREELKRTVVKICRRQAGVVALVLVVPAMAVVNWILDPEQASRWLGGSLLLPLLWFGPTLGYAWWRSRRGPGSDDELAVEAYALSALALAVVAIGILQVARLGIGIWVGIGHHGGDLEERRRILGLAASTALIVTGNAVPKILTPLSMLPLHLAERVTAARRFVGAALVIEGLVLAVAFLALPIGSARALGRWVILGVLTTLLGAVVWMNLGPARHPR